MKTRFSIALSLILTIWILSGVMAASQRTLLDETGLPLMPGSKVMMEANIPPVSLWIVSLRNMAHAWSF